MDEMSMLLHEGGAGGGGGGVLLACREASRFGVSILYRGIFLSSKVWSGFVLSSLAYEGDVPLPFLCQ